ncbi:hypothetical protein [Belliella pelovolcani]|uniref:hypothetical protein n=1 Tax=Belliella pelovolcani TaxID=529505 RepID=UPI00391D8A8A
MKKIIYIFILLLASSLTASAQQPNWKESVYMHVSKSIASTGEPVWLAIDVRTTSSDFSPSMAYVELVNRNGQSVYQLLVPLEEGKGSAILKAPHTLISDHYLLRSYTRSSPFTGDEGLYNQLITIINPEKPAPAVSGDVKFDTFIKDSYMKTGFTKLKSVSKSEVVALKLPEEGILSVSLKNPFLEEKYQGRLNNRIYKYTWEPKNIIPEPYGHIIHAKIRNENTKQAYYLSAHGRQNYFNIAESNAQGELFFELAAFRDLNFLLVQKEDESSAMDFELVSPFISSDLSEDFQIPALKLSRDDEAFLNDLILAGQVEDYYFRPDIQGNRFINTALKADKTYFLDDYNRFESMEVTLKEYVSEVYVRKSNRQVLFKVMNSPTGLVFQENPLLLIDNMPVVNANAFAAFDPKEIASIDLITRTFYFNDQVYAGVISLTSKQGDFGGFELPSEALYLDYYKFAPRFLPFQNEVILEKQQANFPDFRNQLYWNQRNNQGNTFVYPSKLTGQYEVKQSHFDGKVWRVLTDVFEVLD